MTDLVDDLLDGDHRALARVISKVEDRSAGYREIVADLHRHAGQAHVVGVTGSPGAGKSTLVDRMAAAYRDRGDTVGVIAIDPASPFTGGAVLGDRIRMASNVGDMDVFFRSMSARGALGGLSTATTDAVTALDAFGKDVVIVETVGAGQNEIDVVRTADSVAVLVPPGSGDDVQMLKAGILEIADCFVVNKADLEGADRTVRQLREMLQERDEGVGRAGGAAATGGGHHGAEDDDVTSGPDGTDDESDRAEWTTPVLETVAKEGQGVDEVLATLDDHLAYLEASGRRTEQTRGRYRAEILTLLREEVNGLVAEELAARGGVEHAVDRVLARESDPYAEVAEVVDPLADCLSDRRSE